jgi:hypothetical protein
VYRRSIDHECHDTKGGALPSFLYILHLLAKGQQHAFTEEERDSSPATDAAAAAEDREKYKRRRRRRRRRRKKKDMRKSIA